MSAPTEKASYEGRADHLDDHALAHDATTSTGSNGVTTPDIDFEKAASFKPSKLHGKGLGFMITFVAGTGVSSEGLDSMEHADTASSRSSDTTRVFFPVL